MASGWGLNGGPGRCFVYWQEFRKCYAMADFPEDCILPRDDYFECLHHTKEKARAQKIKAEEKRQREIKKREEEIARKHSDSAAESNVMRLGIVEKAKDDPSTTDSSS